MTDSDGNGSGGRPGLETRHRQPMPDKRQRLVEGARLVLHQQGVEKTTLADIARAADVPVGNVYYYFKTKDELVQAAIDAHTHDKGPGDPGEKPVITTGTPQAGKAHRSLRADARRNRERILESAREVFAERGAEAQIDDVVRRAGVGVGTIYRHFPTKEALLAELVRQNFVLMAEHARKALEADGEPFEVIEGLLRRNAAATAKDVGMQYAIANAGERAWTQARVEQEELIAATGELIERARRAGAIRADIRPMDVAMLMCGVCTTMGPRPGFDWRRHLDLVVDVLRPRD